MSESILSLTENASSHVQRLMARENLSGGLRVAVAGGGCSGMSYKLAFEGQPSEGDVVIEQHGVKVFVDPKSALFLSGMVIDYVDGLGGAGFTFQNPNAKKSCGCGSSFSA